MIIEVVDWPSAMPTTQGPNVDLVITFSIAPTGRKCL
jgi:hypothetical protein